MQHCKLLKIESGEHVVAHPVDGIDKSKPAIFVFEGIGAYDLDYAERAENKYLAKMVSQVAPNPNANLYTIQTDFFNNSSGNTINHYNHDPKHFTTPVVDELVGQVVLAATPNISWLRGTKRKAAIDSLKTTLSRQMAIGYSLGASIIQEMPNAMQAILKKKGFSNSEIMECVEYFGAGTIGNSSLLTHKNVNFSQLHTLIATDEKVAHRSKGENLCTDSDPHPHPYVNCQNYGANNLAIVSTPVIPQGEERISTHVIKIKRHNDTRGTYLPEEGRVDEPSLLIANPRRLPGEPPHSLWSLEVKNRDVANHHDLYLNSNIDRKARLDLQTYGFNPGANIFWQGMERMMQSISTGYGHAQYQPLASIIDQVRTEFLSPEGKHKTMEKIHTSIKTYQAETQWIKDNQPRPSR